MKNLTKKIGIGLLSTFLAVGCTTQKYSTNSTKGSLLDKSEYALTSDILKDENKKLDEVERKFNRALDKGETIESPAFMQLFWDYQYQKSIVDNYQSILRMDVREK
jgi:hypothetical protein